eukprot:g45165.t1
MKFPLFVGCGIISIAALATSFMFDPTLDEAWLSWKSFHKKQYNERNANYRRMVWEDNMKYIANHNLEHSLGKHTFTIGMNQFGDLV